MYFEAIKQNTSVAPNYNLVLLLRVDELSSNENRRNEMSRLFSCFSKGRVVKAVEHKWLEWNVRTYERKFNNQFHKW